MTASALEYGVLEFAIVRYLWAKMREDWRTPKALARRASVVECGSPLVPGRTPTLSLVLRGKARYPTPARQAIRALGSKAVPYLEKAIVRKEFLYTRLYNRYGKYLSPKQIGRLPRPVYRWASGGAVTGLD